MARYVNKKIKKNKKRLRIDRGCPGHWRASRQWHQAKKL